MSIGVERREMTTRTLDQQLRDLVPYITSWSEERNLDAEVIMRGQAGIGYADETERDRDERGVLWVRESSRIFEGRLDYGRMHPGRQRLAMRLLLCQVCGEQGLLWLLPDDETAGPDWPEGVATTRPPVCRSCAPLAVDVFPDLRRGWVAVRARRFPLTGVYGLRYQPARPQPIPVCDTVVTYRDPAIRWTRAARLVRTLFDCTTVTLDAQEPQGGTP
jgi:hypothetical protein